MLNYQRVLTVRKHTISAGISVGNRWAGYGSNKVLPWWSPVRPATSLGMLNMFGYVLIPKMRNTLYIYTYIYIFNLYSYIIGILLAMEKRQRYANTGFQPCGFWGCSQHMLETIGWHHHMFCNLDMSQNYIYRYQIISQSWNHVIIANPSIKCMSKVRSNCSICHKYMFSMYTYIMQQSQNSHTLPCHIVVIDRMFVCRLGVCICWTKEENTLQHWLK